MDVAVKIHKTDAVGSYRVNQAINALERFDNELPTHNLNPTGGVTDLDNSENPNKTDSDRYGWVQHVETRLDDGGWFDDSTVHIAIYNASVSVDRSIGGAGFACWKAGESGPSIGPKSYRTYGVEHGAYSISSVNSSTGSYPYSKKIFKSTVIHELCHSFDAIHGNGEIEEVDGKYRASPMCTWYVEQNCVLFPVGDNDKPIHMCSNDKDVKGTCSHKLEISGGYCIDPDVDSTTSVVGGWITNHSSNIK